MAININNINYISQNEVYELYKEINPNLTRHQILHCISYIKNSRPFDNQKTHIILKDIPWFNEHIKISDKKLLYHYKKVISILEKHQKINENKLIFKEFPIFTLEYLQSTYIGLMYLIKHLCPEIYEHVILNRSRLNSFYFKHCNYLLINHPNWVERIHNVGINIVNDFLILILIKKQYEQEVIEILKEKFLPKWKNKIKKTLKK